MRNSDSSEEIEKGGECAMCGTPIEYEKTFCSSECLKADINS